MEPSDLARWVSTNEDIVMGQYSIISFHKPIKNGDKLPLSITLAFIFKMVGHKYKNADSGTNLFPTLNLG